MMRNRNSRLSLAALLAFAMTAGACSCGDEGGGSRAPKPIFDGVVDYEGPDSEVQYLIAFGPQRVSSDGPRGTPLSAGE